MPRAKKTSAQSAALAPTWPGASSTVEHPFNSALVISAEAFATVERAGLAGFVIDDAPTAQAIGEVLSEAMRKLDEIETERKKATTPLNALKRTIDSWFDPAKKPLTAFINELKALLASWDQVQEAQRREALLAAAQAVQAQDAPQLNAALTVAHSSDLTSKPQDTGFRRKWVATVASPDLVPYDYLCPDLAKIEAHAASFDQETEPTPIAGVRFSRQSTVIGYR